MNYKVKEVVMLYTENDTIIPDGFGGWEAVNVGTADATVLGYPLAPGEGITRKDLPPYVKYDSQIAITVNPGAAIRISMFYYNKQG